jgi:CarD family transcriptional regulator
MRNKFRVNDFVVYPGHGVGTITKSELKEIFGESQQFYTVEIADSKMKIMIPESGLESTGLRKVLTKGEIEKVFKTLAPSKVSDARTWNMRYRDLMDKIKSGEFKKVCDALASIHCMKAENNLSFGEHKLLDVAYWLVVNEVQLAYGLHKDKAEEFVSERMKLWAIST